MALWQKTLAPFSEHKGGVGPFLKIPRSNSVVAYGMICQSLKSCSAYTVPVIGLSVYTHEG